VFTYICKRTKDGRIRCARYPITYNGLKTEWRRHRKRSGIQVPRQAARLRDQANSRNLKIVQKALNHADIKTTRETFGGREFKSRCSDHEIDKAALSGL